MYVVRGKWGVRNSDSSKSRLAKIALKRGTYVYIRCVFLLSKHILKLIQRALISKGVQSEAFGCARISTSPFSKTCSFFLVCGRPLGDFLTNSYFTGK